MEPPAAPGTPPEVGTPVILTEEVTEEIVVASTEEAEGPIEPASSPESRPAPPAPEKVADPFSVEEIEAEFARLSGRPLDTGKKG